jgi:hypothetical protein
MSPDQIEVACILLAMSLIFLAAFGLVWFICWIFFGKGIK